MAQLEIPDTLRDDLRTAWHRYVDQLVPLRPALYGYCRRLAGNVWDAEDLVQDTLLRAFAHWGVTYPADPRPACLLAAHGDERLDRHGAAPADGSPRLLGRTRSRAGD